MCVCVCWFRVCVYMNVHPCCLGVDQMVLDKLTRHLYESLVGVGIGKIARVGRKIDSIASQEDGKAKHASLTLRHDCVTTLVHCSALARSRKLGL